MDVKNRKKKGYSGDINKNSALSHFPSAYLIANHFDSCDMINEESAFLLYGEIAVASKIDILETLGYKFKHKRKWTGFLKYYHEWRIIRD
jgi:hypothetical protein